MIVSHRPVELLGGEEASPQLWQPEFAVGSPALEAAVAGGNSSGGEGTPGALYSHVKEVQLTQQIPHTLVQILKICASLPFSQI